MKKSMNVMPAAFPTMILGTELINVSDQAVVHHDIRQGSVFSFKLRLCGFGLCVIFCLYPFGRRVWRWRRCGNSWHLHIYRYPALLWACLP